MEAKRHAHGQLNDRAYREPPRVLVVGLYVAALLGLVSFVEWLGW